MLTHAERSAGKWWRAQRDAELKRLNAEEPVNEHPPPYVRHIRHLCPGIAGRSVSFDYAEVYVTSPALMVSNKLKVQVLDQELAENSPPRKVDAVILAGRFGYVYREGRCAGCGHTARSLTGRVVDGIERLPTGRKVIAG